MGNGKKRPSYLYPSAGTPPAGHGRTVIRLRLRPFQFSGMEAHRMVLTTCQRRCLGGRMELLRGDGERQWRSDTGSHRAAAAI